MKYAINLLRLELSALKSHMRLVAATEFKMECAGQIEEIKQAIKSLRQTGKKCEWNYLNDGTYITNCGEIYGAIVIYEKNKDVKFCPYCGRKIVEK